jgi:DNA gyrase/topoisomerase IV subunit B
MVDKKLYTKDSIESLSPLEFTRLRPQVYAGDCTYSTQLLVEIVSNAVDEFRLGHGNRIEVNINKDIISVRDYGQGFLVNEKRDDGTTILEAAFSILNTSGKYREDGTYEGTSLGSFGIGSKITTFLSHWLDVTTYRDGKAEKISFKEGIFEKREVSNASKNLSGTFVEWKPSEEFFTHTEVEINKIKSLFKTISCLCPGLTIELNDNGKNEKFYSEQGLNDLVDDAVKDNEIIKNRFNMQFAQDKYKMDMVLTYTTNYSSTIVPYVNTGLTETGPHITQLKTLLTREFNKFFREKKWLKDKDDNLTGDDIQEGMYIVFNMTAPNVGYDAQVKSRVTKIETTVFTQAIGDSLRIWLEQNEKEIKAIADKAINAKKAREAAKKARETARGMNKKKEKALKFDSKLADCYSKDRMKCEIYITEGDSASGNLKMARNNEFQAVMPVRGKILNTQKATLDKIRKNAEIMTMIDAFGLKVDPKTMKLTYDEDDLRYGKIIIMSDADVDGAHIKNLFYTFIWNFCPQLIEDGYVYAGVPPLYKITEGKDKYIYLKNDEALEEYRKSHAGKKYQVGRMKGLGEMDVEETEKTLTNPDERIIKQISVSDIKAADALFDKLMGTGVVGRKEYIKAHSEEATYNQE